MSSRSILCIICAAGFECQENLQGVHESQFDERPVRIVELSQKSYRIFLRAEHEVLEFANVCEHGILEFANIDSYVEMVLPTKKVKGVYIIWSSHCNLVVPYTEASRASLLGVRCLGRIPAS